MKFKKKPIVIDAWQVGTSDKPHWLNVEILNDQIEEFTNHIGKYYLIRNDNVVEGRLEAHQGQWIIRGVKGELYVCDNDIFGMSYDVVKEK